MQARDTLEQAVIYAVDMLQQGADIAARVVAADVAFEVAAGPHLRHVIEHYDALLQGLACGVIDYDNRPRDRRLERDPALARARCAALAAGFRARIEGPWPPSLAVAFDGGAQGEQRFVSGSTPLRELLFVAGHAVHHYALLRLLLKVQGLVLSDQVGKAAATLRYEREQRR